MFGHSRIPALTLLLTTLALPSYSGAQEAEAPLLPREGAVVERGDAVVDFALIDAFISRIPANRRAGYMNDPERIELMLQGLLVQLQLAHDAEQLGIDDEPMVREVLRLERAELLAKQQVRRIQATVPDADFEQLAYERYLSSPSLYTTIESRDLRHLVVFTRNHGIEGARAKAEALLAEYRAGDDDFETFVRENSEETSIDLHGGLLNKVPRNKLDTGFAEAAFGIENKGEVVGPVKTKYGFHLIQLVENYPSARREYADVKGEIVAELKRERLGRKRAEFLDNLKAAAPLRADPELVASLRTRYLPGGPGAEILAEHDRLGQAEDPAAETTEQAAADKVDWVEGSDE